MTVVFTERELDIMAVLWKYGPSTVAEVRALLADPVSHNTVATMLTILEDKGYVEHTEEGRAFRYRPIVERAEAGRSAFSRLTDTIFGGSAELFLAHFVGDKKLTKEQLEGMRRLIDERLEILEARSGPPRRKKS